MIYHLCLGKKTMQNGDYSLLPLRKSDMYAIKEWRNSQMNVLRQSKLLTDDDQDKYYMNVIMPLFKLKHPDQLLFSYMKSKECIGYGGLVNINWQHKRAELSFLLNPERVCDDEIYKKEFTCFIRLIKSGVCYPLLLHRIYTETYEFRTHHIQILENNGFKHEGILMDHVKVDTKYINSIMHGCLIREREITRGR